MQLGEVLFDAEDRLMLMDYLESLSKGWEPHRFTMFGKVCRESRRSMLFGGSVYAYSGQRREPLPITPVLRTVMQTVQDACPPGAPPFNSVLVNVYDDQTHFIPWHCDKGGKESGGYVASINFGAQRPFQTRPLDDTKTVTTYHPNPGQLIVMEPIFHATHQHRVPCERRKRYQRRINLTFRCLR